jgi:signal transduction histidine kinase
MSIPDTENTVAPVSGKELDSDLEAPVDEAPINFTVDAALLHQLGERLVGRPAVALAELVKNSYDADATVVRIVFESDTIRVIDNGHGMGPEAFRNFWMRIGTPHKEFEALSPTFRRPLTGSKGVGRLAVQFLSREVQVRTTAATDLGTELNARVDWDLATKAGDLTAAKAFVHSRPRRRTYAGGSPTGTAIVLRRLQQEWTLDDLRSLAQELWALQPPFVASSTGVVPPEPTLSDTSTNEFRIQFESPDPASTRAFERQMGAILEIWDARIRGVLERNDATGIATAVTVVEFKGEEPTFEVFEIPDSALDHADYEIRVFKLQGKQAAGIHVDEARDYFRTFGGVHVYDAGFHLPYYGGETDWLGIEADHSHRLSKSSLLPESLQVERGMNFLPTNLRLFGVVRVDTSAERNTAEKLNRLNPLAISVTRDRLVEGPALSTLRDFVRWGLDLYAMRTAVRAAERTASQAAVMPIEDSTITDVLQEAVEEIAPDLSAAARRRLVSAAQHAARIAPTKVEKGASVAEVALLGPLATAGIATIAFDHELVKQFQQIESILDQLRREPPPVASEIAAKLSSWLDRARGTRALFSHIVNEEDRTLVGRFPLASVIRQVVDQAELLLRGIGVEAAGVATDVRLPPGTFAEWAALFQNVFLNAANAMSKSTTRKINVTSRRVGRRVEILVQDTGTGVDLKDAEQLFQPFVRKERVQARLRQIGLAGTGLGLTIVRMIANTRGAQVSFVEPTMPYKTAFKLQWTEAK